MSDFEEAIFRTMVPQLEAEGFRVLLYPPRKILPPFLSNYRPDAVAYKGDRKIAFEVVGETRRDSEKLARLRELFANHPDWELRFVYAPPRSIDEIIPVASKEDIEAHLKEIESSLDAMGPTAALLIAWAVFEAAARWLTPSTFEMAQTPNRLLEALASEGAITPDEADTLRQLSRVRNAVAHGRLDIRPERDKVEELVALTRALLRVGTH
jgi:uncharacterized protein YutE (UPF0331/DUF86 family)